MRDLDDDRAQREALDRIHAVPPKLERVLLAGARTTDALGYALAWLETELDLLVLQGGTGSSKSIAAGWAFEFIQHRAPVTPMGHRRSPLWLDARALAAIAPWNDRFWSAFDNAALVVIDDAGIEDDGARVGAALERVVNVSTARCIVTTNLGGKAFADRYGARVISRLKGAGKWTKSGEPDFREPANLADLMKRPLWPSPKQATPGELAMAEREAEEKRLADEEHARTAAERAKWAAAALAKFEADVGMLVAAKRPPSDPEHTDDSDNERRREMRRRIDEVAASERAAWLDDPPSTEGQA